MNSKAKKIAAVFAAALCTVNVMAAGNGFSYLTDSSTLTTNYELKTVSSPFASLVVLPYGIARETFDENTAKSDISMFKMCYTAGKVVDEEIQFGEEFKSGAYILYIESGTEVDKNAFIISSDKLEETVSLINSGATLQNVDFGADVRIFAAHKSDINLLIRNARTGGNFTNQTFIDTYMATEGIVRFKSGDISLDEFVDLYDSYFGTLFADYDEWSSAKKEKYTNVLKQYKIQLQSANVLAEEALFVSECHMAADVYTLQDLVLTYINSKGMSLGNYSNLNSYNQYTAFGNLFEVRGNLASANGIYNKFIELSNNSDMNEPVYKPVGGGGGGIGGSGGGMISSNPVVQMPVTSQPNSANAVFTDVRGHWAAEYILKCYKNGLVNGFDDNTFKPEKTISRAELTVLLTNLLKLEDVQELNFNDVSKNSWYYSSIAKAYNAGIINGYGDYFGPESNVTRQDMAVMILRSLSYSNLNLSGEMKFDDMESVSDYAIDSISKLGANGIITGNNNNFRPKDYLTRAEAATIICRVSDYITGGGL